MDYLDYSQELSQLSKEFREIAYEYKKGRAKYAEALNKLTALIYKTGLHNDKAAFENKLTKLLATSQAEEAQKYITQLNESQADYKGLKMVCKAYQAEISAIQSVIKYNLLGELNENIANKANVESLMTFN